MVGHRSTLQSRVTVDVGLWWLTSVSLSVSSREVRLHDQDDRVKSSVQCPVKCREVTVKKKRVEIYGMVTTAQPLWVPRWGSLRLAPIILRDYTIVITNSSQDTDSYEEGVVEFEEDATEQTSHPDEEIVAQSICTSLTGLGGWTYAVQRYCHGSSKQTCSRICAYKKLHSQDLQTKNRQWRASAALHVYKNRPSSSAPPHIFAPPKLGLKVYVYPNVNSVGCGPNYCCCHVI